METDTVAIVVDLTDKDGGLKFFTGNEYLGGAGSEDPSVIIIPWNKDWSYLPVGTFRIARITKK
jgi:hypothetical protein